MDSDWLGLRVRMSMHLFLCLAFLRYTKMNIAWPNVHMWTFGHAVMWYTLLAEILAQNLKSRRSDLTQDAFARKLGISRPTLTRLESAAQNTTINTLEQIAKALRCSVCDLLKMMPEGKWASGMDTRLQGWRR
jgi:DNA-binding Xre family transcriptional regulator